MTPELLHPPTRTHLWHGEAVPAPSGGPYTPTNGPHCTAVSPSYCGLLWGSLFCTHSVLSSYLLQAQITGYKGLRSPSSTASLPDPIWMARQPLPTSCFYLGKYSAIFSFDYLFLLIGDLIWLRVYGTNVSSPFRRKKWRWLSWWNITYTHVNSHTRLQTFWAGRTLKVIQTTSSFCR